MTTDLLDSFEPSSEAMEVNGSSSATLFDDEFEPPKLADLGNLATESMWQADSLNFR